MRYYFQVGTCIYQAQVFTAEAGTVVIYYYVLSQDTIDETIDARLTEKEMRMTEIMESMPIPLFNNISEDLGDEDIKALIRDYVRRTKES